VNFSTGTQIVFTNGVSTSGGTTNGTLVAYKAETATLACTDGSKATTSTGGAGVSLTVGPATHNAYRISAANGTPTAGGSDALTITAADQYGNTVTSVTGVD